MRLARIMLYGNTASQNEEVTAKRVYRIGDTDKFAQEKSSHIVQLFLMQKS